MKGFTDAQNNANVVIWDNSTNSVPKSTQNNNTYASIPVQSGLLGPNDRKIPSNPDTELGKGYYYNASGDYIKEPVKWTAKWPNQFVTQSVVTICRVGACTQHNGYGTFTVSMPVLSSSS
mgnify:FL=1